MGLKENADCDACGEKDYIEHFSAHVHESGLFGMLFRRK